MLRDLLTLTAQMTVGIAFEQIEQKHVNPKQMQREVRRELAQAGITTKAQEAMRLQIERNKQQRQQDKRAERDALREYKRTIAREKSRAHHKRR